MAKYGSDQVAFMLVDGFDLKGDLTQVSFDREAMTEETHGLGDAAREYSATGLELAMLSQQGFYDDAADAVHTAVAGLQATVRSVLIGLSGNAIGRACIGLFGAFAAKYTRLATRGQLHKANAEYRVTGQVDEAVILQHDEVKTADWNTEGANAVDNGASSANGGVGYLQVKSITGFTAFIGKVRHSADNITFADLITFVDQPTQGAQRLTVAGTVNRYLAVDGDVDGSGSIRAILAFKRNP